MCRDTAGAGIAGPFVGPCFAGRDDGEGCSRSDCFENKSGVSDRGLRLTMGSNMPATNAERQRIRRRLRYRFPPRARLLPGAAGLLLGAEGSAMESIMRFGLGPEAARYLK
jgi:hypothetical protein